jgi:post-segregation antitoxin (ccd killing protein)
MTGNTAGFWVRAYPGTGPIALLQVTSVLTIDISDRKLAEQERAAALSREQAARWQAEETAKALQSANGSNY